MKKYSRSQFGETFEYEISEAQQIGLIDSFVNNQKPTVAVQGLGFVGAAMVAALSMARDASGDPMYNIIGIDLPDEKNYWKIAMVNQGRTPICTTDDKMHQAYRIALKNKNVMATYSSYAYEVADIVVVDIHLDIHKSELGNVISYDFSYDAFQQALRIVADRIGEGTLVVIETTVPPGTTGKVVYPIFEKAFGETNRDISKLSLVHSYERVMPGKNYFDSVVNYYRVYAGINENSAQKAHEFFSSFINVDQYPLTCLHSTTASEMSKVLENSYRAANIAFLKEWTEFAHTANVNLFEVINAIKVRDTHRNIMFPGFGVGGYCLTKDALLADYAFRNNFGNPGHLDMSIGAIAINDLMPDFTYKLLKQFGGNLSGKYITIFGVSYLNDVADTRYSPTDYFFDLCTSEGCLVNLHDSLVSYWEEKDITIKTRIDDIPELRTQVAVFTVKHKEYLQLAAADIIALMPELELLVDANNLFADDIAKDLISAGIKVIGVGKGHWNALPGNILNT